MSKHKLIIFALAGLMIIGLATAIVHSGGELRQERIPAEPQFKPLTEERKKCLRANCWDWEVKVFMQRQFYSAENLERVFQFYSAKYENLEDHLLVSVYTDMQRYESRKERGVSDLIPHWDALFQREKDKLFTTDYNEWYSYAPDLDNPSDRKRVVLKGVDPYDPHVDLAYVHAPIPKSTFDSTQSPTGFAFDELVVELPGKDTYNIRRVEVLLPKEVYNKQNLERLFRFYSGQYPNREEVLEVLVYTDIENVKRKLVKEHLPGSSSISWKLPSKETSPKPGGRSRYYDAWYHRIGDSYITGGDNEYYDYSPNLDSQEKTNRVVLKGKDPAQSKR